MNEHNEYPLNEKLLEETVHLIERWRMLIDRHTKIEEYRTQVSETVFERVKEDYNSRLHKAVEDLLAKKIEVDSELSVMEQAHDRAISQLEEQRHSLEEIELRNKLGEFTDEEYKTASTEKREKIEKLSEVVASVEEGIERYHSLFEDVDLKMHMPSDLVNNIEKAKKKAPAPKNKSEEEADEIGVSTDVVAELEATPPKIEEEVEPSNTSEVFEEEFKTETEYQEEESGIEEVDSLSPSTKITAKMVMIAGEDAGTTFDLTGNTSIGRAESSTITINDSRVSRQHARIQQHGEEFIIVDLHSSNGTFVNGQKIDEYVLAPGDEVQIGDTVLQFQA